MNEPEIKFTKRWNDYLEQYRESARKKLMEKRFSPHSRYFLAETRTISCWRLMNGFDKVKEKMDNVVLPNLSSSSSL